ncbi:MAG: hypothetical protein ACFUZC_18235 [Chthoniobacteraceae bacterium]
MIRVSLTLLIFIYLTLFLMAVIALWVWAEWRRTRNERRAVRFRVRCSICSFEFEDPSDDPLPRCPRCGSPNERDPFQLL